jgi:hypothetical protein
LVYPTPFIKIIILNVISATKTKKIILAIYCRFFILSGTNLLEAMKSIPNMKYKKLENHEAYQMAAAPIKLVQAISNAFILIIQTFCNKF